MEISGSSGADVAAPPEACFDVLIDYARYPEWWPGCTRATIVAGDPAQSGHEVELTFDTHSPIGQLDVRLRFAAERPHRLVPERVAGRLGRLGGDGWELEPTPDGGTRVRYDVRASLDTGLPRLLERPLLERARRFLVEEPVRALKRRVESAAA